MAARRLDRFDPKELLAKSVLGGLSCMIPLPLVNPLEVIKIRLQMQGELSKERDKSALLRVYGQDRKYKGVFRGALQIVREERLRGLYKGFTPAAFRELVYAGIRFGFYDPLKRLLENERGETSVLERILCGAFAGSLGAAIATPLDLLKVRMQADTAAAGQARRYRNTAHALLRISGEEGIRGLWRGVRPNVQRAMILSATMMPSYDLSKHFIIRQGWVREDNIYAQFGAAMISGFLVTVVSSPIDVVKTRVMNESQNGKYVGAIDCLRKTFAAEGVLGLYKGFVPAYMRLGPHTLMAFVIFEKLRWLAGYRPV